MVIQSPYLTSKRALAQSPFYGMPRDMMLLIFYNLITISEMIKVGSVCKHWYSISWRVAAQWPGSHHRRNIRRGIFLPSVSIHTVAPQDLIENSGFKLGSNWLLRKGRGDTVLPVQGGRGV